MHAISKLFGQAGRKHLHAIVSKMSKSFKDAVVKHVSGMKDIKKRKVVTEMAEQAASDELDHVFAQAKRSMASHHEKKKETFTKLMQARGKTEATHNYLRDLDSMSGCRGQCSSCFYGATGRRRVNTQGVAQRQVTTLTCCFRVRVSLNPFERFRLGSAPSPSSCSGFYHQGPDYHCR